MWAQNFLESDILLVKHFIFKIQFSEFILWTFGWHSKQINWCMLHVAVYCPYISGAEHKYVSKRRNYTIFPSLKCIFDFWHSHFIWGLNIRLHWAPHVKLLTVVEAKAVERTQGGAGLELVHILPVWFWGDYSEQTHLPLTSGGGEDTWCNPAWTFAGSWNACKAGEVCKGLEKWASSENSINDILFKYCY